MIIKNFLTGEYVIFSQNRTKRLNITKSEKFFTPKDICPFCIENKNKTFTPIYSSFDDEIRIVQNKYPIIDDKFSDSFHYVLIDTKEHEKTIKDYTDEHMFYVLKSIKDMFDLLSNSNKIKCLQIFKNQGKNAGASQSHSHWQIITLPILPKKQSYLINALQNYENKNKKCYFCNMDYSENLIYKNENFLAFCPKDALYCYEINVIPINHITSIQNLDDKMLYSLGCILKNCIKKLNLVKENIDYNICLYNAFKGYKYHFFIQIIPRIYGTLAGFEFSTGMFVNSVLWSDAVKILRG